MFTTGSKLFLGAGVVAAVGAVLYGVLEGGALGTTGLTFASVVSFLLAGVSLYTRDANVSSMDVAALHVAPAAQPAPGPGGRAPSRRRADAGPHQRPGHPRTDAEPAPVAGRGRLNFRKATFTKPTFMNVAFLKFQM